MQGIPVLSYNADGTFVNGKAMIGSNRLAYVGQALYISGQQMGNEIAKLIPGGGDIVIFIATPGTGNIQPRYDGAASVLKARASPSPRSLRARRRPQELPAEKAYLLGHKSIKGAFAVDAGSTEFLGPALQSAGLKVPSGGFDTLGNTLSNIQSGLMDFTIYQDPYLQGFLPVLYLYLYNLSGGTLAPPDTDTGLTIITKQQRRPVRDAQPVPGLHDGAEVHPAPVRRHQLAAGHHEHLTGQHEHVTLAPAAGVSHPRTGWAVCRRRLARVTVRADDGCKTDLRSPAERQAPLGQRLCGLQTSRARRPGTA